MFFFNVCLPRWPWRPGFTSPPLKEKDLEKSADREKINDDELVEDQDDGQSEDAARRQHGGFDRIKAKAAPGGAGLQHGTVSMDARAHLLRQDVVPCRHALARTWPGP